MTRRLLKVHEVAALVGFSKSWVYQEIRTGNFPPPIYFGRIARWDIEDIDAWIAARKSARQAQETAPVPEAGVHA